MNSEQWAETGMPDTIFNNNFTGPIGDWLSDEITHFKFGCILDASQVTNGFKVDLLVDLAAEQNSNDAALTVLQRTKEMVII